MSREVLTGTYFVHGDWACAEGAIAAGCKFYAAYPITPASEIAERMALRLPHVGGGFVQFEDELGAMASVVGASYAGAKAMTATSGPGLSLMQENIGLAVMTEALPLCRRGRDEGGSEHWSAYEGWPGGDDAV